MNIRPRRSAHLYRRIWSENGSPLVFYTCQLAHKLQHTLSQIHPKPVLVEAGMRYGDPSIASALRRLRDQNASRIIVLPLFPQFSGTTSGSIFDAVMNELSSWRALPGLIFIRNYYDHPAYIQAIAGGLKQSLAEQAAATHLLFSFHGIPRGYVERGDPYHQECIRSAEMIATALDMPAERWSYSFQSRFGAQEWLRPYTKDALTELAGRNIERLDVACPGFAVDCLKTLDEIGNEGLKIYHLAGGGEYRYLPALNDSPEHVKALAQILEPYLSV